MCRFKASPIYELSFHYQSMKKQPKPNEPEQTTIATAKSHALSVPEIMQCSPQLRWVKRGNKHMLQQLWSDIYSSKQEWRDVPRIAVE